MKSIGMLSVLAIFLLYGANALVIGDIKNDEMSAWNTSNSPQATAATMTQDRNSAKNYRQPTPPRPSLEAKADGVTSDEHVNSSELVLNGDPDEWMEQYHSQYGVVKRDQSGEISRDSKDSKAKRSGLKKRGVNNCLACMFSCWVVNQVWNGRSRSQVVHACLATCMTSQTCTEADDAKYQDHFGNSFPPAPPLGGYTFFSWDQVPVRPIM